MRRVASVMFVIGVLAGGFACGERDATELPTAANQRAEVEPAAPDETSSPEPAPTAVTPPAPPPLFPRGLVVNEPDTTAGYVLFNPLLSETTYLVDNDGQIVHTWKTSTSPGGGMYLLPNGHLLRPGRDPEMLGFRAGGTGGILQTLDWDGNVVWEWRLSDERRVQHHDVEPLSNGNILLIAWEVKSPEEALRVGRRPGQVPEQGLWPDWLVEIEPVPPSGANIVWEWHVWDHLVQNHDPGAPGYGDPAAHPERLDINAGARASPIDAEELAQLQALGYVPADAQVQDLEADFLHVNAIAYHPRLDQIALSVPELGEVWIIDHSTTMAEAATNRGGRGGKGGDLLYRFGNPAVYGRGGDGEPGGAQRFFYQHDVRWVPDGWNGAGNLTVFNNGRDRPAGAWSSIDEWTPPMDADGNYAVPPAGEPFGPSELAWQYRAKPEPTSFFAPFISGAQRLPNGNTMICSGTGGRFLEVTRAGDVVWEYRNPFSGSVRNADGSPPQPGLEENPYAVFRATRIPASHPALPGRGLRPLDPQPEWHNYEAQER
jgi:hypothetical protein